ncbi:hypothetical protein CPC08DRAFT_714582 [Agrocybe pediades]|nr:hypothetical protein CPC08DRAFT_714582 [Agrocybe pediades]
MKLHSFRTKNTFRLTKHPNTSNSSKVSRLLRPVPPSVEKRSSRCGRMWRQRRIGEFESRKTDPWLCVLKTYLSLVVPVLVEAAALSCPFVAHLFLSFVVESYGRWKDSSGQFSQVLIQRKISLDVSVHAPCLPCPPVKPSSSSSSSRCHPHSAFERLLWGGI